MRKVGRERDGGGEKNLNPKKRSYNSGRRKRRLWKGWMVEEREESNNVDDFKIVLDGWEKREREKVGREGKGSKSSYLNCLFLPPRPNGTTVRTVQQRLSKRTVFSKNFFLF